MKTSDTKASKFV